MNGRLRVAWARAWGKVQDPVIADKSVDLAFAVYWACFTGWGVFAVLVGIPTISISTTAIYELWWGSSIAALSAVAATAALATFRTTPSVRRRIRRKQAEMAVALLLFGLLAVYPLFLAKLAAEGDTARAANVWLGVQYLIFPLWRARHLYIRVRKLRGMYPPEPTRLDRLIKRIREWWASRGNR